MKESDIKIIIVLFILFLLDLIRPFSYSLHAEFLFVGVIFLFLNYRFWLALSLGIIFGYLKDLLSFGGIPFNLIEFFLLLIIVRYMLSRLSGKVANVFIVSIAITVHIILNSIYVREFSPLTCLVFFIHTISLFLLTDYLLKRTLRKSAEFS